MHDARPPYKTLPFLRCLFPAQDAMQVLPTAVIHDPGLDMLIRLSASEEEDLNSSNDMAEESAGHAIHSLLVRYEKVAAQRQRVAARQVKPFKHELPAILAARKILYYRTMMKSILHPAGASLRVASLTPPPPPAHRNVHNRSQQHPGASSVTFHRRSSGSRRPPPRRGELGPGEFPQLEP